MTDLFELSLYERTNRRTGRHHLFREPEARIAVCGSAIRDLTPAWSVDFPWLSVHNCNRCRESLEISTLGYAYEVPKEDS